MERVDHVLDGKNYLDVMDEMKMCQSSRSSNRCLEGIEGYENHVVSVSFMFVDSATLF
jgi:hypothetical protein